MKPKLTQEQKLTWKLTQQLGQAIEILQYNGFQLQQFLEEQMKENPLIEIETESFTSDYTRPKQGMGFDESFWIDEEQDLADYMKEQLIDKDLSPSFREIVEFGIDSLDENGYLTVALTDWQLAFHTGEEMIEEALELIQSLEPAGIGARTLQECLALQLRRKPVPNHLAIDIVTNHLEWVADYRIEEMVLEYGVSEKEIKEAIQDIQALYPKPGILVAGRTSSTIIPDGEVYQSEGTWKVALTKWNRPSVTIYDYSLNQNDLSQEEKEFFQKYTQQGKWLQKALIQRSDSLERVFAAIVKHQILFFDQGPERLKPLVLREIAEELNLHVSTVSRAVKEKYLQTPHGVFPVKFFFQSGLKSNTGEISAYAIKILIKEMIDYEDKQKPLSDQKISELLKHEFHIEISRRTVAKYRLELKLPSSNRRKRRMHNE
ncbi:RNA polymerase sigma-54 factor [Salinibacillus kushneri]|uniref:RNA polymerase sigma-54 factor n=1 Tax=Salinibacillus kushneri TaxID=237682 RepID=A0A1H9YKU0_9BACI|nr:RNA polymerase factor sigma-54 [Salinibacillus kushneri]SES69666.1 RNA polymerase sigma-54 factor [Salinibacillus kushneri]